MCFPVVSTKYQTRRFRLFFCTTSTSIIIMVDGCRTCGKGKVAGRKVVQVSLLWLCFLSVIPSRALCWSIRRRHASRSLLNERLDVVKTSYGNPSASPNLFRPRGVMEEKFERSVQHLAQKAHVDCVDDKVRHQKGRCQNRLSYFSSVTSLARNKIGKAEGVPYTFDSSLRILPDVWYPRLVLFRKCFGLVRGLRPQITRDFGKHGADLHGARRRRVGSSEGGSGDVFREGTVYHI